MTGKEASNLIEAALYQAITSNADYDAGDILLDWVVVAYVANPDEEKGGGYPLFYSNGQMPHYRVRGLLTEGLSHIDD